MNPSQDSTPDDHHPSSLPGEWSAGWGDADEGTRQENQSAQYNAGFDARNLQLLIGGCI